MQQLTGEVNFSLSFHFVFFFCNNAKPLREARTQLKSSPHSLESPRTAKKTQPSQKKEIHFLKKKMYSSCLVLCKTTHSKPENTPLVRLFPFCTNLFIFTPLYRCKVANEADFNGVLVHSELRHKRYTITPGVGPPPGVGIFQPPVHETVN